MTVMPLFPDQAGMRLRALTNTAEYDATRDNAPDLVTNPVVEDKRQTHEQMTKGQGSHKVILRRNGAGTRSRTRDLLITN